jgi:hypothetical protein
MRMLHCPAVRAENRATPPPVTCASKAPNARVWNDCCGARQAFALEPWREIDAEHLVYESIKPGPGGSVSLMLTTRLRTAGKKDPSSRACPPRTANDGVAQVAP